MHFDQYKPDPTNMPAILQKMAYDYETTAWYVLSKAVSARYYNCLRQSILNDSDFVPPTRIMPNDIVERAAEFQTCHLIRHTMGNRKVYSHSDIMHFFESMLGWGVLYIRGRAKACLQAQKILKPFYLELSKGQSHDQA